MAVTAISTGVEVTSFGHEINSTTVTAIAAPQLSAVVGQTVEVPFNAQSVSASQTALVKGTWVAQFTGRLLSVSHFNEAITGTSSFDIYNSTTSTVMLAATTLTTATAAKATTIASNVFAKGDVIQFRCTTAGSSSITVLTAYALVQETKEADNGPSA